MAIICHIVATLSQTLAVSFNIVNTSNAETTFVLTQECKDGWKPSKRCHIGIHWMAFVEYSQMSTISHIVVIIGTYLPYCCHMVATNLKHRFPYGCYLAILFALVLKHAKGWPFLNKSFLWLFLWDISLFSWLLQWNKTSLSSSSVHFWTISDRSNRSHIHRGPTL